MERSSRMKNLVWYVSIGLFIMIMAAGFSGCAGSKFRKSPFSSRSTVSGKKASAKYVDFGDVLVPSELDRDDKNSFIYQTPGFAAGVLSLKGRVELNSLIRFFETNMARDQWKTVSSFKSPRTILLYQKQNRFCVISISEGDFSTHVEIWVAPTQTQTMEAPFEEGLTN